MNLIRWVSFFMVVFLIFLGGILGVGREITDNQIQENATDTFECFESVSSVALTDDKPTHISGNSFIVFDNLGSYQGMGTYTDNEDIIMATVYFEGNDIEKIELLFLNDGGNQGYVYDGGCDMDSDDFIDIFEEFEYEHIKEAVDETNKKEGETA